MEIAGNLDDFSLSPRSVASLKSIHVSTEVSEKLNKWLTTVPVTEQVPLGLFSENKEFALPDKAPELYSERVDKKEDAISFFKRVYKPWLDKGVVIYQDNLRGNHGLDPKLLQGIRNQYKGNKQKVAAIVPPKSSRVEKEVKALKNSCDLKKMARLVTASYSHN